nr:hypothetical protein [Hoylesella enoeca]
MKTNIASIFAAATLALFTASCANEETTKSEASQEETIAGMTFVGGSAVKTRTSLDVTLPGGTTVDYFWEPSDKIWTADGATGTAQITSKSATANFRMSKAYTTSTVEVYYPGQNASAYNQVTIATNQTQTEPNSTKHLGAAGDCGTATAHKQSDNSYKFDLDHKASYLCLLPRTPNKLVSTYISQIKITADNNIAGTYTLTNTGLTGSGSSNTITITTSGSSHPNGFPLNNAATSQSTNAIYAVIAPGTHALTVEYTLYDNVTGQKGIFTKTVASAAYDANTVYPITANINPKDYSAMEYYMFDAAVGQHYWKGYESVQPQLNGESNDNYPKSGDPRFFQLDMFGANANYSCKDCFPANRLAWYMQKGEPHWEDRCWTAAGHLYTGGLWLKKINIIATKNSKTLAEIDTKGPDGYSFGGIENAPMLTVSISATGEPANSGDYFFLPTMGQYTKGKLADRGIEGYYWSNTPWSITHFGSFSDAYLFRFNKTTMTLDGRGGWGTVVPDKGNIWMGCPLGVEQ